MVFNYIKTNIWINFIFMVYITCLVVKAQINYMWFLKEFKMSEILCVSTFDIITVQFEHNVYTMYHGNTMLLTKTTCFYTLHWLNVINIKLHLYQSWVSRVSIHDNCHVVILIKCKSLKILIESIFKAPNVTLLCTWLQHVSVYVCPFLGIHNFFFSLQKMMVPIWLGFSSIC